MILSYGSNLLIVELDGDRDGRIPQSHSYVSRGAPSAC